MALSAIAIDADAGRAPALPSVAVAQTSPVARRSATAIQPYELAKRAMDVVLAAMFIVLLLPIFVVIGLAIVWDSGFPILYRGERVGRHGRTFRVAKFRSMRAGCDQAAHAEFVRRLLQGETRSLYKVPDDARVTRVGAFLRRTSLDELPQLWNVLRGEMSLVGPRPDVPYAVAAYPDWVHARLNVRPGITGLWQVSGRSRVGLIDMYRLDVAYASRTSLPSDIRILLRTVPVVLGREGAA